jgi:uridine phosphorylase
MSVDALYADPDSHTVGKLQTAGVLAIEMEADTLFVVSSLRGWRAGALFACVGASAEIRTEQGREALGTGEAQEMRIAVEALKTVADSDMQAADT